MQQIGRTKETVTVEWVPGVGGKEYPIRKEITRYTPEWEVEPSHAVSKRVGEFRCPECFLLKNVEVQMTVIGWCSDCSDEPLAHDSRPVYGPFQVTPADTSPDAIERNDLQEKVEDLTEDLRELKVELADMKARRRSGWQVAREDVEAQEEAIAELEATIARVRRSWRNW